MSNGDCSKGSSTMTLGSATAVAEPPEPRTAAGGGSAPTSVPTGGAPDDTSSGNPAGWVDAARFTPIREIGKGGMATIYLADDNATLPPRKVALKLMHGHLESDPGLVRRFEHEVRSQIGLEDPSIVELIGWGRDPRGQLFMALEYVDGPALRDLMTNGRRLPVDVACFVALRMLQGLAVAHARGLVHRDIKPANVMLTLDGRVKIADFGISKSVDMTKLTSTGNVIGTPAYMSPEQALAHELDARSDLFSVGVTLYEMLSGANPFQTGNPATTLSRVVHHQQRPVFETLPQTPAALEELVDGLLQKDPEKRTPTAQAAIEVLARCIRDEDLVATQEALAQFIGEPDATTRRLGQRRARRCLELGQKVYAGGKGPVEAAVWQFFVATLLDPACAEARTWLEQVSRERGYNLDRKPNARIDELEATLRQQPDDLHVILQLAKLHKAQGNFLQVIFYYKRAKALRPADNYTRNQIETLVPAQAATLIDGTGMFETAQGVPVRMRPPARPAQATHREAADGWGDFVRGVLSTGWGKVAAVMAVAAVVVIGGGWAFDRAVMASKVDVVADSPAAGDALDAQVAALENGRSLADGGHHDKAERQWRKFLEQWPESGLASEVTFRLGDSLERQGRRQEALDVHADNARKHLDDWSLRSREDRGEMLLVDGDVAGARAEYEAVVKVASGEQRVRALMGLGKVGEREGRLSAARRDLEDAARDAEGTKLHDDARLALAGVLERQGETTAASALYFAVRESTDHRGDAFRDAVAGIERTAGAGGGASEPVVSEAPVTEAPVEPAVAPAAEAPAPSTESAPAGADAAQAPTTGLYAGLGEK